MTEYGTSEFGFEDLDAYKAAKAVRQYAYALLGKLPADERFALSQQMRRSAVSITSNIAEGYGRFNWQETSQFCRQARGSLFELVDQASAALDQEYISGEQHREFRRQANTALKLLNGYIRYLQRSKKTR